jgi:hypothetical protein
VLLSKESNAIEHLARFSASFFETKLQICVLTLELLDSFRARSRSARGRLERFDARLCVKRAATKRRELVTEMTNQLVEIGKRLFQLSLFVV